MGDLGNVLANEQGHVKTTIVDSIVQLIGPNSIIGRAVVIDANADEKVGGWVVLVRVLFSFASVFVCSAPLTAEFECVACLIRWFMRACVPPSGGVAFWLVPQGGGEEKSGPGVAAGVIGIAK